MFAHVGTCLNKQESAHGTAKCSCQPKYTRRDWSVLDTLRMQFLVAYNHLGHLKCDYSNPRCTWKKIMNHNVFRKQNILKFFANGPIKYKTQLCNRCNQCVLTYVTSQETALQFMTVIGPFPKNLENLIDVVCVSQLSADQVTGFNWSQAQVYDERP